MSPPLLTKLSTDAQAPGLQIVLTAFDGFLYVIDGVLGALAPRGWLGEGRAGRPGCDGSRGP